MLDRWRGLVGGTILFSLLLLATVANAAIVTGIRQLEGGEAPRFDIKTDQPFTYEAYQMPQVLRYVVDLHKVEPGMVSNLTKLDTPSVKRVLLQQKELNGLKITRVIFDLSRELVGRVVADEGGRRLLVAFSPPVSLSPLVKSPSPPAYQATPMPTPTAEVANHLPPLQKKALVPVVPASKSQQQLSTSRTEPPATLPSPAPVATPAIPEPAVTVAKRQGPLLVQGVKIENDGVLVELSGDFGNFSSFTLRKPGRVIIDLPPGTTHINKPVAINRFGLRSVRAGMTPQRLRIVLEALGDNVPAYEVHRVDAGLKIVLKNGK